MSETKLCPHCKHPITRHGPTGCGAYREFTNVRWPCRCDATHGTNHPPRHNHAH
jgi:hypothetical protein